jgi:hypothetical protein
MAAVRPRGLMVISYKCRKPGCRLLEIEIPDIRCLRSPDGKGRVCSACNSKMVQAKTMNVTSGPRNGGRGRSRRSR